MKRLILFFALALMGLGVYAQIPGVTVNPFTGALQMYPVKLFNSVVNSGDTAVIFTLADGTEISTDSLVFVASISQEQIEDYIGAMLAGNTETGIAVTYQDADGTIDFVIADLSGTYEPQMDNSAGLAAALSDETGTGVAVFGTSPTFTTGITIGSATITATQADYLNSIDRDLKTSLDSIAGAYDGAGGGWAVNDSLEVLQDLVGDMVTGNTETNISVTYQDADGTLDFVVSGSGGDVSKVGTPSAQQVGVWTGDGTIEGTSSLTFVGGKLYVGSDSVLDASDLADGELGLAAANNLSDLDNAATALTNLGLTATAAEINYTDGVTSNIQTQLGGKSDTADVKRIADVSLFFNVAFGVGNAGDTVAFNLDSILWAADWDVLHDLVITKISAKALGTSPDIDLAFLSNTTPVAAGATAILTADMTVTTTTTWTHSTSFNDATVAAGESIMVRIDELTTKPTGLTFNIIGYLSD